MAMANEEQQTEEVITITDTSTFNDDMFPYYLKKTFSDITLIVDGQHMHAHKIVLAARCKFFESLLSSDPKQFELVITGVSPTAFRKILKYIYTGSLTIKPSDGELIFNVLKLAHEYSLENLEIAICEKMTSILDMTNVCAILNKSNLHDMDELRKVCHNFINEHISEILESDFFNVLTQKSMIKLLEGDSFLALEIDVFKIVEKWCKANEDVDNLVIHCVRLFCLTSDEILTVVWPSKLVDNETVLSVLTRIRDGNTEPQYRARLVKNQNLVIPDKARVISGMDTVMLLNDNQNLKHCAYHLIGDKNGITVDLGTPVFLNHIKMRLKDDAKGCYRYYITLSYDQIKWVNVVDYRNYNCRSYQNLFFDQQVARYIRIVGTYSYTSKDFRLVKLEIYLKSEVPQVLNQIVCPNENVATVEKGAIVIEGTNPGYLINGNIQDYNMYSYHHIGSGNIVVQLAQPYMISSMRLLLADNDGTKYRYFIETSVNKTEWEIAVDRRNQNCNSWQNLEFQERMVVYVKITGTQGRYDGVSKIGIGYQKGICPYQFFIVFNLEKH